MCSGICPVVTPKVPRERPQPEQNASLIGLNFPVLPPPLNQCPPGENGRVYPPYHHRIACGPDHGSSFFCNPFRTKGCCRGLKWDQMRGMERPKAERESSTKWSDEIGKLKKKYA